MEPAIWTVIGTGGPAVVLMALLIIYGVPKFIELMGWQSAREKEIQKVAIELAKEGATTVIARLETELKEHKDQTAREREDHCEQLSEMLDELRTLRAEHVKCQVEAGRLEERLGRHADRIKQLEERLGCDENCNERPQT